MWSGASDMKANQRNIVLTGFMGTGKTTTGKVLAERLNRPFIDTDAVIVQRAGKSIPEIFAQDGEGYFRYLEGLFCRFFAAQGDLIVSTGGGMLVNEGNLAVMQASGLVICLTASPATIAERVGGETGRPLLKGDWETLYQQRQTAYGRIRHQVDTTGKETAQVVEEIMSLWQSELQ